MEINISLIKERMQVSKLSLADLSFIMGVDKAYVWRLVNGKSKRPTAYRIMQLKIILGIDDKDLFQ